MPKVGTRDINNVTVEIHASTHGSWSIVLPAESEDGRTVPLADHATSLDAAITKARAEIKRRQVKVHVVFKTREGKRGVAYARHARSRDKILTEIDGKKEHIEWRDLVFKADTPKEWIAHLKEIDAEIGKLQAEKREVIEKWKFDLSSAVDEAVTAAAEESNA